MTDIPSPAKSVPGRLGVRARLEGDALRLELEPQDEALHHGVVRASVLSFLIDAAAGIQIDDDPTMWTLTSDMSVHMRPIPAPAKVVAASTVLRRGRRSVTCLVDVTDQDGEPAARGAIAFARVARRDGDPPKPVVRPADAVGLFTGSASLSRPLRDEAGIEVLDAAEGVVQVHVTPELRNPAGTLQGAMVALLAEAAAEDLVTTRFECPAVVTDLELRYLAQAPVGPVRTRCELLGTSPDAPVQIELIDTSADRLTTLVYARATRAA